MTYASVGMSRFHSGCTGVELCGAWQKMQTWSSMVARTAPGPEEERLCGELTTLAGCAHESEQPTPRAREPESKRAREWPCGNPTGLGGRSFDGGHAGPALRRVAGWAESLRIGASVAFE